MVDSLIQLSPDSTGKKVDTEELTVGLNSVHRERMQIAGDSATDIAPVTAADGLTVNLGTNNDVTVASLPLPSGAATLVEQQTQSTALAAIETAVELIDNAIAGTEMQVDVVTSALPAGASTLAEQQTQTTHLATIAGDTTDIETAVELLDDTVATLGTSTYTEAATKGLIVGAVRRDADTTLVDTTNEVAPLQVDANGRLKVEVFSGETLPVSGTVVVTGSSTLGEQQTQTTHLAAIETAVEILDNAIAGTEMQVDIVAALPAGTNNIGDVDVLSSALPTGASTLAEQQAQTTHLATIAGDTTAIETAVQIIDDWDESDRAKVNLIVGQAGVAAGAGVTGATVQRVVQADGAGKTILSAGGSAASSGDNTIVAAGTNRLKVIAFSLTTASTTAMTCIFKSGAGGTEIWRVLLQAATSTSTGANLSIALPGWLFATASATLLNLNLSSANAVHWSVTYYDEA